MAVFLTGTVLYYLTLIFNRDGSLFIFVSLSSVLFYVFDVLEQKSQSEKEAIVSANPYEDGRIAMMTMDYDRAEKLFRRAHSDQAGDMDVLFQLGVLYHKKKDFFKAKSWLRKYVKQKKHKKWHDDAKKILEEIDNDTADS